MLLVVGKPPDGREPTTNNIQRITNNSAYIESSALTRYVSINGIGTQKNSSTYISIRTKMTKKTRNSIQSMALEFLLVLVVSIVFVFAAKLIKRPGIEKFGLFQKPFEGKK